MRFLSQRLYFIITSCTLLLVAGGLIAYPAGNEDPNLGPFIVHVVDPTGKEKILPNTAPLPGKRSTAMYLRACRGEYEPISFVLRARDQDVANITLLSSDLTGSRGKIPKDNIDIRVVKVWYQAGGAWETIGLSYRGRTRELVPELLLKNEALIHVDRQSGQNFLNLPNSSGSKLIAISKSSSRKGRIIHSVDELPIVDTVEIQPVTLRRHEAKQFWVTVYVPQSAQPGSYKGEITVRGANGVIGKMNMTLQVLPFSLLAPSIQYSIYYRGKLSSYPTISSEYKDRTQFMAELKNMLAHGIANPTVYQRLNRTELEEVFRLRKQAGIHADALYYLGTGTGNPQDEKGLKGLRNRVRALTEITSDQGIMDTYIYGIDEARGDKLRSQHKAWNLVHQNGAKVFAAGYSKSYTEMGDLLDLVVRAGRPKISESKYFHGRRQKIFSYANPQSGPENPSVFRKNYGLELWRNGYDGAMPYAYQESMRSIWNDFDHARYRDHNFTYPTVNGVIDTIAWEGFREGVDDVRYISTLEQVLANPKLSQNKTAQEARTYLLKLQQQLPKNLKNVRNKIIEYLLILAPSIHSSTLTPPLILNIQ